MLKSLVSSVLLLFTGLLPVQAQPTPLPSVTAINSRTSVSEFSAPPASEDPIGSPYPIPWAWILQTQADYVQRQDARLRYYRTPSLVSPDGRYGVYARIAMRPQAELYQSSVSTVLFIEDLATGKIQMINSTQGFNQAGILSVLLPVAWSRDGSRLLLRQLQGELSTSDATDTALIWQPSTRNFQSLSPQNVDYDIAVLLGWHPEHLDEILFRTGILGDEIWPIWAVNLQGETVLSQAPQPPEIAQQQVFSWTGSQSLP
jgi:hypothetical protein